MEILLTQPKDFSSKLVTFNNCAQADVYSFWCDKEKIGPKRSSSDIEHALASLKKELMVVRYLGHTLIKQLMELHAGIQDLKEQYKDCIGVEFNLPKSNLGDAYFNQLFSTESSPRYEKSFRNILHRRSSIP